MTSLGLDVYQCLCDAASQIERLREDYRQGSDAWTALTEIVQAVDAVIDRVVDGPAIDDEEDV